MAYEDYASVLRTKVGELSGLDGGVRDYTDLPSNLGEFPVAVVLPARGDINYSEGGPRIGFDTITITIYTVGTLLPEGFGLAVPFIVRVRDKFAANMKLDGSVEHIIPASPWYEGPGQMRYGNKKDLVGIRFNYEVKENVSGLTVSA